MSRRRGEPCAHENCGSRRFYIGDDGYTYCDQGHQQRERGTVIAEDTGELVPLGRKFKRKDSDAESSTTRVSSYGGADALEHYLLCLQLVLRKQLRWLIEVQKLPEELETLVKDLWALRLQKLQGRIAYESGTDTEGPSSQVFSSQSESESQSRSRSSRTSRRDNVKPKEGTPNLPEALSLCYVGILLLRIPLTVADIQGWVNYGDLLYYRACREVPIAMRERLPPQYQHLLEPQDLLQPQALHNGILTTLTLFNESFGMAVPSINVPLVTYRWMKDLILPLEIFAGTQRLASILEIDMHFDLAKFGTRAILRHPEAQLMALVLVATKLLFPIDKRPFRTRAVTDLSATYFDWNTWAELHTSRGMDPQARENLNFDRAFEFDQSDCVAASDEKLDDYLDWCENNIASEDMRERGRAGKHAVFQRALFEMFPLPKQRGGKQAGYSSNAGRSRNRNSGIGRPESIVRDTDETANADTPSIGSYYRRFRQAEELYGPAKVLFDKAAKLACISLDSMVYAVFLTERKLQKLEDRLRKEEDVTEQQQ